MSLDRALQFHRTGNLPEAEKIYRQILRHDPRNARALQLLGVLLHQLGQLDNGIPLIRDAIAIDPNAADFHNNLGNALMDKGQLDDAINAYRQAGTLRPEFAEAHSNLGNALSLKKNYDEAIAHCRTALSLKPDYAEAHNNLGNALWSKGKVDEAIAEFRRAIVVNPAYASAHYNLSGALRARGMPQDAMTHCREALRLFPGFPDAHYQLGVLLVESFQPDEAIAQFREAIRLKPDHADAWNNLAAALHVKGEMDQALAACQEALRISPNLAEAHMCMANLQADMGRIDAALASCRRAMELLPDQPEIHGNLIFFMQLAETADAKALRNECSHWAQKFAAGVKPISPKSELDPSPNRRLKIGFVSPDFRDHPAGRYFLSLAQALDPSRLEIFCYSNATASDQFTQRIQAAVHHWRNITGLTDGEAAHQIRADQIDILIDLAVHTSGNRLSVFARKPAPMQATWLGYPGTTSLPQIDYRLTDPFIDPPGQTDDQYIEKSLRLPRTFWCIDPAIMNPLEVNPLPALPAGYITFGCLNRFSKVSPRALDAWIEILHAVPNSRLILYARAGQYLGDVKKKFHDRGIDPQRIRFVGRTSQAPEYFRRYHEIDIGLDPFPCAGGVTSIDSLWMGVPFVTLRGQTPVGRSGVSILSNVALYEWIAADVQQYINIAAEKARDLQRLSELRARLREIVSKSPLMDAPTFAREMESAYRTMWKTFVSDD
jgi:protein O-GlcNAc transferase